MRLKRVGVFSCGMIFGVLYGLLGLIFGGIFSLLSLVMAGAGHQLGSQMGQGPNPMAGLIFGVGAIIILPFLYGILGFLGGILMAILYNIVAAMTGGIELTLE